MDKNQELKNLDEIMEKIEIRSTELLEEAKINGSLIYYFDPKKCKENEVIKLENGIETIINKKNLPNN